MRRLARWSSVPALIIAAGLIACSPADRREIRERAVTAGAKAEATLEDAAVTTAIKSKLLADQTVSGMKIDVDTRDGVVTLTGQVASAAAKEHAIAIAQLTEGVRRVEDRLTVSP
jgi:osmotically-inducible protein OsmY